MSRGADLFVVCKNPECGSEVSPYVTECPYCGTRLRKRAPKLDRGGRPAAPRRRTPGPVLTRLRNDEIPGIRGDTRPHVTAALVVATCLVWIGWRGALIPLSDLGLDGPLNGEWWRVLTTQFTYISGIYQFGALLAIGIFGWLLERRHGSAVVLVVFLLCGAGGAMLEVGLRSAPSSYGANGAALGLLAAWAVPDLLALRRGEHHEGDLLGVAVAATALLALPLARAEVSALAGVGGALIGLAIGLLLARLRPD
jgi:membrane associated rhomboid family serine protease